LFYFISFYFILSRLNQKQKNSIHGYLYAPPFTKNEDKRTKAQVANTKPAQTKSEDMAGAIGFMAGAMT
jgi:hypothetical protein